MPGAGSALQLILGVILLWLALGLAGVYFPRMNSVCTWPSRRCP
jgi:hypothetical protein